MPRKAKLSLMEFQKLYATEDNCRAYLAKMRWPQGFVCPVCGGTHYCVLSNGLYQCNHCHHQTSVTSGTVLHRSHVPLTKWFLAFYLVSQDKRGISAVRLADFLGVTYKTAWSMLHRIRSSMGQRDAAYQLSGTIEFDDAFFGGPTVGKKRGRGTEKAKVFVALSLDTDGNPLHLKMQVTQNIKCNTVKRFANQYIKSGSTIHSDGYRSYLPALADYNHIHKVYDPSAGLLHWLHIMISNAKSYILGTYHGLPKQKLQAYLDEFCYRFSRRRYGARLFDRLVTAVAMSSLADSKG